MKIRQLRIHNFRSIIDADIEVHDYTMLVGANNAGKSNLFCALRAFYEDIKFSADDFPKVGTSDQESWVEITFELDDKECEGLADKYRNSDKCLTVRRYFASSVKEVKSTNSNIYAVVNGTADNDLFYGAKNVSTAKVGKLIYIPALTTAAEQMKTTGPSPLREMLNFMLKRVMAGSTAYNELELAFKKLDEESRGDNGFLSKISGPINHAIAHWDVQFDMGINPISPEEITKNLVRHGFVDAMLGSSVFALERYGHGFQRSFLYELLKLAPTFEEVKSAPKKEFDPDLTLILFEEPEAFLHPSQQENMSYHLRSIGQQKTSQVLITSHSPLFAGKAADSLSQIVRVGRTKGVSTVSQIKREALTNVFGEGAALITALKAFVADEQVPHAAKKAAIAMLESAPEKDEVALQEERFRYQLWLDSERSAMFFADRVLLVEGATERALFSYLLAREWHDLTLKRICIVDVLGKYNFHRYMSLLDGFSIPYGLILDDDNGKNHHKAVNDMLANLPNVSRLAEPVLIPDCLERFLDTDLPGRDDKKPVEILKALEAGSIEASKIAALRELVERSLDIQG
ncbi:AAA family ATPase [Herbaspirillum sp. LeCh32-8]|uniref:ATP-dependent nuclease n=1 Tax=Herbaspirillum sp. LeCh32-8 TaxID=2821356 RepID=UPI001AE75FA4|nr:AAA family ATPase [Herbaspirillum sp. LeCh32-8]MBP0597262.1 AAA family ATPase [Herbaspirillum sp. LeCh32-8]